jgi:WD40 repeat protein
MSGQIDLITDLELIDGVLGLATPTLTRAPERFPEQLTGRLAGSLEPGIRRLLDGAREHAPRPWFCPLTPSLAQAGGPLDRVIVGDGEEVIAVAISPNGALIAASVSINDVQVWNRESGKLVRTIKGANCASLAFTQDSARIVTGSYDGSVRIWDLNSGRLIQRLDRNSTTLPGTAPVTTLGGESVNSIGCSPDGTRLAWGSSDHAIRIWNLGNNSFERMLLGHKDAISALTFTPDGARIVSASHDGAIRIWNAVTGRLTGIMGAKAVRLLALAIAPNGTRVIACGPDSSLQIWDLRDGSLERTLPGHHPNRVSTIAITPDGRRIVSGGFDGKLRLWDYESGRLERTIDGPGSIGAVAVTPDGAQMVSCGFNNDNTIRVWRLDGRRSSEMTESHHGEVRALVMTPDARRIVSGGDDGTVRIWNIETGRLEQTLTGHSGEVSAVAITPDGARAVCGANSTIFVWNLESGLLEHTLEGHKEWITSLAVTPDGSRIVSGDHKTVLIWNLDRGLLRRTLKGGGDAIAVLPDGTRIISAAIGGRKVVWNLETGRCERVLGNGEYEFLMRSIVVTPDGTHAVCALDKAVNIWNIESGRLERTLKGHTGFVNAVAVTPDGARVVSGGGDGTIRAWNFADGEQLAYWEAEPGVQVLAVCCSTIDPAILAYSDSQNGVHILRLIENRVPGPLVRPQVLLVTYKPETRKKFSLFRR